MPASRTARFSYSSRVDSRAARARDLAASLGEKSLGCVHSSRIYFSLAEMDPWIVV